MDRMEATIRPGESIDSGRSTEISTSSAGEIGGPAPRQTAAVVAHDVFELSNGNSTWASASIVSAVPAGESDGAR